MGENVPDTGFFDNWGTVTAVTPTNPVTLHFTYEDIDILKTLVMPVKPTVVTNIGTAVSGPIQIGWTLTSTAQDNIVVSVPSYEVSSSRTFSAILAGTATSYTIPANILLSGITAHVTVEAMNKTTDLGSSVMAGSSYQVGNQAEVDILTN